MFSAYTSPLFHTLLSLFYANHLNLLYHLTCKKGRGGRGGRGRGRGGRGGGGRTDNAPYNGPILELRNPMTMERQQQWQPRDGGEGGRGEGRGRGRGDGRGRGRGDAGGRSSSPRSSAGGGGDNNNYASGRDPSKGPSRNLDGKRKPGRAGRGGGGRFDDGGGRRGGRVSLRVGTGKRGRQSNLQQRRGSLRKKDRSKEKALKEERAIERRTVVLPG